MFTGNSRVRVLVADDDETIRGLMLELLSRSERLDIVAQAADGREALRWMQRTGPDIALLDWYMPLLNGFDAGRRMMELAPRLRVLLFSGYPEERWILRALRAGMRGLLPKTSVSVDLVSAVTRVAQGELYVGAPLDDGVASAAAEAGPEPDALTIREREVLQLAAESHCNKEIASILEIAVKTVEHHRSNIMNKLSIHDLPALTRYAVREGLIRP